MKKYLLYRQVQQKLTDYLLRNGEPFSFYEAVVELWKENQYSVAEELPAVSFEEWDVSDIDAFGRLMDETPVDLDIFYHQLETDASASAAARSIHRLDIMPMKVAKNESLGLHQHESFEMLYVMRGGAKFRIENTGRHLHEGELCLIAPHFSHDTSVDEVGDVVSITFSERTIENTLYKLLKSENTVADFFRTSLNRGQRGFMLLKMPPTEKTLTIIRSIYHEAYSRQEYARETCSSYIEILFSHILRGYAGNDEGFIVESRQSGVPLLTILKYIQSNYKSTSLSEIAERFHYEPSYLGKYIKSQTGKNYTEVISELRMEEAKDLLRKTDKSITEISEITGFTSVVHFSRSFSRMAGISPRAYRKEKSEQ